MATSYSNTVDGDFTTDADFRLFGTFIHNALSSAGWVQTSDTGQINLTTVTKPVGGTTSAGYEIWRMDDTLQATVPIFMKIEYGTGANNQRIGWWVTVGKGSDGSGTLTSIIKARFTIGGGSAQNPPNDSYAAGGTSWFVFALCANTGGATWFSIERSKDSTGADDGDGIIMAYGGGTSAHVSHYVPYSGTVPTAETGLQYILSTVNPSTYGADTGIGILIPMKGVAQQPGINVGVILSSDFGAGASFSFTIYGGSHTYQRMDGITTLRGNSGGVLGGTGDRLILRYE
jgi:hypothetical protein